MTKMLQTLSENAGKFQEDTLKNFEAEVKKFIKTIDSSCENLSKASNDQIELLANIAGTIQSVLTSAARDIQSGIIRTNSALEAMTNDAVKRINNALQTDMQRMFQAMADNLASITSLLSKTAKTKGTSKKKNDDEAKS